MIILYNKLQLHFNNKAIKQMLYIVFNYQNNLIMESQICNLK